MKFEDFVLKGAIIANLEASTKEGVVREMIASAANPKSDFSTETEEDRKNAENFKLTQADREPALDVEDVDEIVGAILEREARGTTAFGKGYAMPHAMHGAVKRLACIIGVSREGVDFDSLDHCPVKLFFMFIGPNDKASYDARIEAMRHVVALLRSQDQELVRFLPQCRTLQDVLLLLEEYDKKN